MEIIKCDRCGKCQDSHFKLGGDVVIGALFRILHRAPERGYDLCRGCTEELGELLRDWWLEAE